MICYLLCPEVLFIILTRWTKQDQKAYKGFFWHGHTFFYLFFKLFPPLFLCLSCFSFLLLCLCLRHNQSFVAEAYRSGQFERENLLRAVCLLPRALVGRRPCRGKNSILGNPAEVPLPIEASYLRIQVSSEMDPPPLLKCSRTVANICTMVACPRCTRASEREGGIKARWYFTARGCLFFVSLFCTLKRIHANELFKTCSYLMAVRAIN